MFGPERAAHLKQRQAMVKHEEQAAELGRLKRLIAASNENAATSTGNESRQSRTQGTTGAAAAAAAAASAAAAATAAAATAAAAAAAAGVVPRNDFSAANALHAPALRSEDVPGVRGRNELDLEQVEKLDRIGDNAAGKTSKRGANVFQRMHFRGRKNKASDAAYFRKMML